MALITWNNTFSVGNSELDGHHQKLVMLINDFYNGLNEKNADTKQKALKTFQELKTYTLMHFQKEEDAMAKGNYPDLASHKKLHEELVKAVLEYEKKLTSGDEVLPVTIGSFLRDWLYNHIMNHDKKYSKYIK